MAKIIEEIVIVKFSKIVKDTDSQDSVVTADINNSLVELAQEFVGRDIVVEIERV